MASSSRGAHLSTELSVVGDFEWVETGKRRLRAAFGAAKPRRMHLETTARDRSSQLSNTEGGRAEGHNQDSALEAAPLRVQSWPLAVAVTAPARCSKDTRTPCQRVPLDGTHAGPIPPVLRANALCDSARASEVLRAPEVLLDDYRLPYGPESASWHLAVAAH